MDSHRDPQPPPVARRHLTPVSPIDPDTDLFEPLLQHEELDEFARRQLDLFTHLIEAVGDPDALWRLDASPIPDEPFDWSAVEEQDVPFVTQVVARSDEGCDALLDAEFRTIARRILARVAARDPRPLRRSAKVDRCAAALVWLAGQASGEFGRRGRRTAQRLWDWFGVGNCSDRGRTLRSAAGLEPEHVDPYSWGREPLTLGDPVLLHSRCRASLIAHRDAMLEVAGRRRSWSMQHTDGRIAHVNVKAEQTKVATVVKGLLADRGRATVIVGFGDHVEDASYFALSIPDARELVRMVQRALDGPLPRGRRRSAVRLR
jgi:hypothetical protein